MAYYYYYYYDHRQEGQCTIVMETVGRLAAGEWCAGGSSSAGNITPEWKVRS